MGPSSYKNFSSGRTVRACRPGSPRAAFEPSAVMLSPSDTVHA